MSKTEINLAAVFRRISNSIDLLTEDEIKRLSDSQYDIEIRMVRRRAKEDSLGTTQNINIDDIIEALSNQSTRLDAQSFLDAKYSNKKILEQIARRLDIPIVRQDKVEILRDKIIEATVGARIRSQAIQGTGS